MPSYLPNTFESFESCIQHTIQPELFKLNNQTGTRFLY